MKRTYARLLRGEPVMVDYGGDELEALAAADGRTISWNRCGDIGSLATLGPRRVFHMRAATKLGETLPMNVCCGCGGGTYDWSSKHPLCNRCADRAAEQGIWTFVSDPSLPEGQWCCSICEQVTSVRDFLYGGHWHRICGYCTNWGIF